MDDRIRRMKEECEQLSETFPLIESYKGQMARRCLELIDHIEKIEKGVIEILPSDRQKELFKRMSALELTVSEIRKYINKVHEDPNYPQELRKDILALQCHVVALDINTTDQRTLADIPKSLKVTNTELKELAQALCADVDEALECAEIGEFEFGTPLADRLSQVSSELKKLLEINYTACCPDCGHPVRHDTECPCKHPHRG